MNHSKNTWHPSLRVAWLAALAPVVLWACSGGDAPTSHGPAPKPTTGAVAPTLEALRAEESKALDTAVSAAGAKDRIDVWVAVDLGPLEPAPLPPTVTTLEVGDDGVPRSTLDGKPISEKELSDHADAERRAINASLSAQFAARERRVAEIVAELGAKDEVPEIAYGGFTLRTTGERLRALLPEIARRGHRAALPPRVETHSTSMTDALTAINVEGYALAYGMNGSGIGIWHNEPYPPNFQHPMVNNSSWQRLTGTDRQPTGDGQPCVDNAECCSNYCSFGTCASYPGNACSQSNSCGGPTGGPCTGTPRLDEHSTATGLTLQQTAPGATFYNGVTGNNCLILSSIVNQTNPPVYAGSMSFGYTPATGAYSSCDQSWDYFIQSSRIAMFNSTANSTGFASSPGTAFNVTSVGMSDPAGSLPAFGWGNPNTHANKPEISAPGVNQIWGNPAYDNPGGFYDPAGGCSISTPFAAGFAADMMSGSAYYRNNPQAVKANMTASANGNAPGTRSFAPQIDYLGAYFYRSGSTWNGNNGNFFDGNGNITQTTSLTAGAHYRIAISWLAYAPNVSSPTINQSLTLEVSQGSSTHWSTDPYSNYQVVDLTPQTSGTWTITIHRATNQGGAVNLALSVGQIVDF